MNLAELLSACRIDLQDTGATPRWPDATLYVFLCDAIRDYSNWFPRRIDRVLLTESNGAYPLPSDYVEVVTVESPIGTYLSKRCPVPGAVYTNDPSPRYYTVDAGSLYLYGSPASGVYLSYKAVHSFPTSETDVEWVCSIPDRDIELIRLYVSAKAHMQMRGKQSRLDRFDMGSGRRDDNPVTPETTNLMDEYRAKINERFGGRAINLYRP